MLHLYFKNEYIIQYKRDSLYGINDFICECLKRLNIVTMLF
jgi:hypothetical protein